MSNNKNTMPADSAEHAFEVADKFETLPDHIWEVKNRMVDVDTGELLYRLRRVASESPHSASDKIIPERELTGDGSEWRQIETGCNA